MRRAPNRIHVIEILVPTQKAIESGFEDPGLTTGESWVTLSELLIYTLNTVSLLTPN